MNEHASNIVILRPKNRSNERLISESADRLHSTTFYAFTDYVAAELEMRPEVLYAMALANFNVRTTEHLVEFYFDDAMQYILGILEEHMVFE